MRLRRRWAYAVALALPVVLAACSSGGAGSSGSTGDAAGMQTISVAVSGSENPIFAPYLAAMSKGYFADRKITIKQDIYESGTLSYSAFAGGSDDFCICGATQTMTAGAQGRDVVGVFNQYIGGAVVFVGAKKYEASRGTDLTKYNGSIWGYSAEGSVSQVFMARAADAKGIGWQNQQHLAVGAVSAFLPALQSGRVDIITMDSASAAQAIKSGIGYAVFNTNDPALVEPIWGRQLGLPLVTTKSYLAKNPELAQRFVSALHDGLVAVQQNSDDPNKVFGLMPQGFQGEQRATYPQIWPLIKDAFSQVDGTFTPQQISDTQQLAVSTGVIPAGANVSGAFDNSFAQKAIDQAKGGT
jgi:NitT/TauT family transport system substrate-binding protein